MKSFSKIKKAQRKALRQMTPAELLAAGKIRPRKGYQIDKDSIEVSIDQETGNEILDYIEVKKT